MNNITEQQQINTSMIGADAIGNGILNQTDGSLKPALGANNNLSPEGLGHMRQGSETVNLNQSQGISKSPNINSSVHDISQDAAHLAKTGIIGRNNPKLQNLGQNNMNNIDVSQNLSVFDMTNNQVVPVNDLSQSQVLAGLDQTQQQPISPIPTDKVDPNPKGQQNDTSLLGVSPENIHGRNRDVIAATAINQVSPLQDQQDQSLVQELKNLNLPNSESQPPARTDELQSL